MTVVDRLGRKQPELLGWGLLIRAIPGLAGRFRPVPADYFLDHGTHVNVECPCGARPSIEPNQAEECECGRLYLNAGGKPWAARLKPEPGAAEPPAGVSAGHS